MSLTIDDIVAMELLQSPKWLAGRNGGGHPVVKVGIWDHETLDNISGSFEPDELILTNLLSIRDRMDQLLPIVQKFIDLDVAGLVLKTIYFEDIDEDVKRLAEEADFPIISYNTTFIEDIILQVGLANRLKDENALHGQQVSRLLSGNLNPPAVKRAALALNKHFHEGYVVFHVVPKSPEVILSTVLRAQRVMEQTMSMVPHGDGFFLIITRSSEGEPLRGKALLESSAIQWLNLLNINLENSRMGISDYHVGLETMDIALREALVAVKAVSDYSGARSYGDLGLLQMLIPMMDSQEVKRFFEKHMGPIIEYDLSHDSEWVQTLTAFVGADGDYKKAAGVLHQHPNTVRYRIDRIKEVMGFSEGKTGFYETAAVLCGLYPFLKDDE